MLTQKSICSILWTLWSLIARLFLWIFTSQISVIFSLSPPVIEKYFRFFSPPYTRIRTRSQSLLISSFISPFDSDLLRGTKPGQRMSIILCCCCCCKLRLLSSSSWSYMVHLKLIDAPSDRFQGSWSIRIYSTIVLLIFRLYRYFPSHFCRSCYTRFSLFSFISSHFQSTHLANHHPSFLGNGMSKLAQRLPKPT